MSDPFEPFDTHPDRRPRQQESADLPAPLTDIQQRLQQLRPRQPQLDLALLDRLATADPVSPSRVATGFSKMRFVLAVAAAWLCGVIFGAVLLLGIGYRSSHAPAQDQLAASDTHELTPAPMEQTAPGNESADGGAVADAQTPMISATDAPAAASPVQERQLRGVADSAPFKPAQPIASGVLLSPVGLSDSDWESPLRANSLRLQLSQQVFIRAYQRSTGLNSDLSPSNRSPAAGPVISARDPESATGINIFQPPVPKTRQQWMNDLLANPAADIH